MFCSAFFFTLESLGGIFNSGQWPGGTWQSWTETVTEKILKCPDKVLELGQGNCESFPGMR